MVIGVYVDDRHRVDVGRVPGDEGFAVSLHELSDCDCDCIYISIAPTVREAATDAATRLRHMADRLDGVE